MVQRCLNDKDIFPDDKVLEKYLGKTKVIWDSFIDLLKKDYPLITPEWRYYNDGKSWLFKVTKKGKTVCWVSVWEKFFKTTFYFNVKAESFIKSSNLDEKLIDNWLKDKNIGKIKPITIEVKKKADLKTIKDLIELKEKIK